MLFNTPPGDVNAGEWGLAALPGRSAEARRDIELALEYACQLDCPQVHIMAGVVQPGMDRAACEAELFDNLRYAAERFARHGKRALIEALNPQTKPGYFYHSQYQTLEIAQRVDRPNIAVQLDLFHAQKVDGNLSHLITEYAGQYRHIQIASCPTAMNRTRARLIIHGSMRCWITSAMTVGSAANISRGGYPFRTGMVLALPEK